MYFFYFIQILKYYVGIGWLVLDGLDIELFFYFGVKNRLYYLG